MNFEKVFDKVPHRRLITFMWNYNS